METSAGSTEGNIELQSKRKGNECLTCGARARSVGAREVIGRGSDVGRRGESGEGARRSGRRGGGGDDESQRAGRGRSGHDEGGRRRPGPVQGGLGQFSAVWVEFWAGLGCSWPV